LITLSERKKKGGKAALDSHLHYHSKEKPKLMKGRHRQPSFQLFSSRKKRRKGRLRRRPGGGLHVLSLKKDIISKREGKKTRASFSFSLTLREERRKGKKATSPTRLLLRTLTVKGKKDKKKKKRGKRGGGKLRCPSPIASFFT